MAVRPAKTRAGEIVPGKWDIDFYIKGRKVIRRLPFQSEQDALAFEMDARRKSKQRAAPVNPKVKDVYSDFLAEYRNDHQASTIKDMRGCWEGHLLAAFGDLWLSELSPQDVEGYKAAKLAENVTRRTINKHLSYLSAFVTWCLDNGHRDAPLRIRRFPAKMTRAPQPKVPVPQDLDNLIRHLEPQYRPIALLMTDAGLRRSEALNLRGEDVHGGLIYVRGKGNKERVLPIPTRRLREALERVKRPGYLFLNPKTGKPYYGIRKALKRAAVKAKIDGRVYHHLLRHAFGTHSLTAGMSMRAIQMLMGHSSVSVTEGYAQLLEETLGREARKLDRGAYYSSKQKAPKGAEKKGKSGP